MSSQGVGGVGPGAHDGVGDRVPAGGWGSTDEATQGPVSFLNEGDPVSAKAAARPLGMDHSAPASHTASEGRPPSRIAG